MSDEEIRRLRRSIDGLRKEHRDLKDRVENEILEYLKEERDLMKEVRDGLADYQELIEEIERFDDEMEQLKEEMSNEVEMKIDDVRGDFVSTPENIVERLKKLETRVDALSSDE